MSIRKIDIWILIIIFWFYALKGILFPGQLGSILYAICDGYIFLRVFVNLPKVKNKFYLKSIIVLLVAFFITLLFTISNQSLIQQLNGFRGFLYYPVFLVFFYLVFKSKHQQYFIKHFNRSLLLFIIIQTPISIYQYSTHRIIDYVGGSFGFGGSGLVSLLLFVIIFYLLLNKNRYKKGIIRYRKIWLLVFFIPILLNGTQISFVILPIMFFLLLDYKRLSFSTIIFVVASIFFVNFVFAKMAEYSNPNKSTVLSSKFLYDYLLQRGASNKNRGSKLFFVYNFISQKPVRMAVGSGYGLFKGRAFLGQSTFAKSQFDLNNESGNTSISAFLAQGGFLIVVIFLFILLKGTFKNIKESPPAMKRFVYFFYFILFVPWVYLNLYVVGIFSLVMAYFSTYIYFYRKQDPGKMNDYKVMKND